MGKRTTEVLKDSSITRFSNYVSTDYKMLNELNDAFDNKDSDKMREVLSRNSSEAFLPPLMDLYDGVIIEITKKILMNNEGMLDGSIDRRKLTPEVKPFNPNNRTKSYNETIEYKRNGKTYVRSKPRKFTKTESDFLKNTKLDNKTLSVRYNELFPNRSYQSIISKRRRVKNK